MRKIKLLSLLAALFCAVSMGATPTPQVLWCEGNSTLYFINAEPVSAGDTYAGQTVTQVMATGNDVVGANTYWHWESINSDAQTVVFDASFADARPTDCGSWFDDFTNLSTIEGLNFLNLTEVGNMGSMFDGCEALTSIDLSYFNTPALTWIDNIFSNCTSLVTADLSGITTANILDLAEIFNGCSSLQAVDLGNFEIPDGIALTSMFEGCENMRTIYVDGSKWDASIASDGSSMFEYCEAIVGGSGTTYDEDEYEADRAIIDDRKNGNPGYLTEKNVAITANADPEHTGVYYNTFFSYGQYKLPAGVEAFAATLSGGNMVLTSVAEAGDILPAQTPVILRANNANFTLTASVGTPVTITAENDLRGTDAVADYGTPSNCYVLNGRSDDGIETGVGFYPYSGASLAAHKAYIIYNGSGSGAPRRMHFVFNAPTGVENVQGDKVQSTKVLENGALYIIKNDMKYNVQGQIIK